MSTVISDVTVRQAAPVPNARAAIDRLLDDYMQPLRENGTTPDGLTLGEIIAELCNYDNAVVLAAVEDMYDDARAYTDLMRAQASAAPDGDTDERLYAEAEATYNVALRRMHQLFRLFRRFTAST